MRAKISIDNFTTKIHNGRLVVFLQVANIDLMFYGVTGIYASENTKVINDNPDFDVAVEMETFFKAFMKKELPATTEFRIERDDMFGDVYFIDILDEPAFHFSAEWVRGGENIPENPKHRLCIWGDDDKDEYLVARKIFEKEIQDESQGL